MVTRDGNLVLSPFPPPHSRNAFRVTMCQGHLFGTQRCQGHLFQYGLTTVYTMAPHGTCHHQLHLNGCTFSQDGMHKHFQGIAPSAAVQALLLQNTAYNSTRLTVHAFKLAEKVELLVLICTCSCRNCHHRFQQQGLKTPPATMLHCHAFGPL